jgi:hypothetical protein
MNINPTKKTPTAVNESQELKDKIRRRAYQLYEERLWEDGHELEDWPRGRGDPGAGGPSQGRLIRDDVNTKKRPALLERFLSP